MAEVEPDPQPDTTLPPGMKRRRDGLVVDVLATIGGPPRRPADPEGMTGTWYRWP